MKNGIQFDAFVPNKWLGQSGEKEVLLGTFPVRVTFELKSLANGYIDATASVLLNGHRFFASAGHVQGSIRTDQQIDEAIDCACRQAVEELVLKIRVQSREETRCAQVTAIDEITVGAQAFLQSFDDGPSLDVLIYGEQIFEHDKRRNAASTVINNLVDRFLEDKAKT